MKKKWKKPISFLLAVTLCLSMTMTAFATESDSSGTDTQSLQEAGQASDESQDTDSQTEETETQDGSSTPAAEAETTDGTESDSEEADSKETEPVQGSVTQDTEEENTSAVQGEVTVDEDDDNVVVKENDKPYLALGADLTSEQQAKVLALMGIDASDLTDYDVVYVTNDMEHQYLDAYLPASTIGTRALSSVLIMEGKKGSGIQVSTKNISYCTVSMYKNALATAGMEDAQIIVAGPTPISGTAALIGALEAYSKMTGEEIKEESLDAAMNELVITGELAEAVGGDTAQAEELMAYLKQEVVKNGLDDEKSINEAIDKGCKEFDITLTESQKKQLLEVLQKISELDLDWDQLLEQASDVYDRLEEMGLLADSGLGAKIKSLFQSIVDFFKSFF